jgi:MerR family transcriptional regulator, light-induced transcriptional regulator
VTPLSGAPEPASEVRRTMNIPFLPAESISISIAAVEHETGLSKDTLRVWERRYGFPKPDRDAFGERLYPVDQLEKLRVVRRLMDQGHRPGKIIGLDVAQLQQLAQATAATQNLPVSVEAHQELQSLLDLIKTHQIDELRRQLSGGLLRVGLSQFIVDTVAPLTVMVGDAWARGHFEIFEEHLYTESVQVVLRNAIATIPTPRRPPRVLFTTFPQESHGLGLLMAEAMFSLEGAQCLSLGVQTPVWNIAAAAAAQDADIIALSFSDCLNNNYVLKGLDELRGKLPDHVEIWAGGSCAALRRRQVPGVHVLTSLSSIGAGIARWRAQGSAAKLFAQAR